MRKTHKGFFKASNPQKYAGNPEHIIFRSGWERRLMKEFDTNPAITMWASEELPIPYYFNGKKHRYYADFVIQTADGRTIMIEVKPYKETKPPEKDGRKIRRTLIREAMTYGVNEAKWTAAMAYTKDHGMKFWIIHENNVHKFFPGVKFLKPLRKKRKKSYK